MTHPSGRPFLTRAGQTASLTPRTSQPMPAQPMPAASLTWPDPERERLFRGWMNQMQGPHGLIPASVRLASADASFRRYLRVDTVDGDSRIIMDAPPDKENCQPFVTVAGLLQQAGLAAPQVLAWDAPSGFMLLTDLGDVTMMSRLDPARPELAAPLYRQAVEVLVQWQLASRAGVLPVYDDALLRRELSLFPDWYVARHRGMALTAQQTQALQHAFDAIVQHNLKSPAVFVHRDFMARNLMVRPQGLAVLDFQDAVYGPITYDIASLMRDAFISWDEDFVLDITVRYWQAAQKAGLPVDPDFGEFYRAVEWMGLQRHLKVAGIFARLTLRDGKPRYLADAPRFIGYIRATAARYRELAGLLRLVDQIENITPQDGLVIGRG